MFTIRIDDPVDLIIVKPGYNIKGWCGSETRDNLASLHFEIGGGPVVYSAMLRPDVEEAYPGLTIKGFLLHLDLSYHMHSIRNQEFVLKVAVRSEEAELRFRITPAVLCDCLAAASTL
jgi:hypothetical protein